MLVLHVAKAGEQSVAVDGTTRHGTDHAPLAADDDITLLGQAGALFAQAESDEARLALKLVGQVGCLAHEEGFVELDVRIKAGICWVEIQGAGELATV